MLDTKVVGNLKENNFCLKYFFHEMYHLRIIARKLKTWIYQIHIDLPLRIDQA